MAGESVEIVTGDDVAFAVTLYKDGKTFAIDGAATVTCAIVTLDRQHKVVANSSSVEGADTDWAASKIVCAWTSAQTAAALPRYDEPLQVEIQVDEGGKRTWFVPGVILRKGQV